MKNNIAISALLILGLTGFINGQVAGGKVIFSDTLSPDGSRTALIRYPGTENPNVKVFETVIYASTPEQCMADNDFSNARPADPDHVSLVFDHFSGTYQLKWKVAREKQNSCRVLSVGESASASGLNVWRANYGSTYFTDDPKGGSHSELFPTQTNVSWGLDRIDQRLRVRD